MSTSVDASVDPTCVPLELVNEIRSLVALGVIDEGTAIAAFHRLIDAHGCAAVGAALVAAPEAIAP